MSAVVIGIAVMAAIAVALVGPFVVMAWRTASLRRRVERQIMITDAIHAELGAVAAPVVDTPVFGPWQVRIAVPFQQPELVGQVVAITNRVLARDPRPPYRIVLTPRGGVGTGRAA